MFRKFCKSRNVRKTMIAALCCVTVTCTGLAAACSPATEEESKNSYTEREDSQVLANGDFEFFSYPDDAEYLIKTANSWSPAGDSSSVMSGVISTSPVNWAKLIDPELASKLDYNNELDSDDDNYEDEYIDYNGMTSKDILYKDSYAANLSESSLETAYIAKNDLTYAQYFGVTYDASAGTYFIGETQVYLNDETGDFFFDEALTQTVRKELIANPETHYNTYEGTDGNLYFDDEDGNAVRLYSDENAADYYYIAADAKADENGDYSENDRRYVSNVLMIHNADTSKNNGLSQYYSSASITVEANTAAEISVWVKTSDLKFDKGYDQNADQNRGAYIEVLQTVNGTSVDSFRITAINTEKLIADDGSLDTNNGWLKYTVYVNGCNFGDSTIQLRLGLGNPDKTSEKVSGYAFFDDVSVTKYTSIDSIESYNEYLDQNGSTGNKTADDKINNTTTCAITSEADEKIFYADREVRAGGTARNAGDFHYLIDLSAAYDEDGNVMSYSSLKFTADNVTAGLTYEESTSYNGDKTYYAASVSDGAKYSGVTQNTGYTYTLPDGLNGAEINTANDLIGVYSATETYAGAFTGMSKDYSATLKKYLTDDGITNLPRYDENDSNVLLLFSAYGAAYTATVNDGSFTLGGDEYVIVSFWVKTFDMGGNTAATVKIYDADDKEGSTASISVDSNSYTVDVGDEENIFGGWAQCFFFVHNDSKTDKTFAIDFSFGESSIASSTSTTYKYGWAALANMQTLKIDETVYNLAGSGDLSTTLTISDTDKNDGDGNAFDEATSISDIKSEISDPLNYTGVNGASSYVPNDGYDKEYDKTNSNAQAGLINKEYFENYDNWQDIIGAFDPAYTSFTDASAAWTAVFGDSYQPLIIINNLRAYAEVAELDKSTYQTGYVLVPDGDTSDSNYTYIVCNGKTYRKVAEGEEYDENEIYYSIGTIKNVSNYGFIGSAQTISADTYVTVSVKVMVSGDATAYIYLVDDGTKQVLGYETPAYSYWYDDEGNVLDAEYDDEWSDAVLRSHIVYELRDDGLYDGKDGKLYGNLLNLVKTYDKYEYEQEKFFDKDGNEVYFEDLVRGETYYTENGKIAPHYLSTASAGTHVFEYLADGNEYGYAEGYYYLYNKSDSENETYGMYDVYKIDGEPALVSAFDAKYAKASENGENGYEYCTAVGNTNGKWVTVNFFVHTGSEEKTYRLELWSGKRGETGVTENEGFSNGAVAFDYSSYSITDSTFDTLLAEYESSLINEYNVLLNRYGALGLVESHDKNLAYYESLIDGLTVDDTENYKVIQEDAQTIREKYTALYYTFSLYDSADYVPFNADTAADGETGYSYTASSYEETLAYFTYDTDDAYNVFIDYTAVNQSVEIGTVSDDTTDEEEEDSDTDWSQLFLYIASIVLVVALLATLASLLIRELVRKSRRKRGIKSQSKNNYRKRERYIRKLHLERNEEVADESANEAPAKETDEATPSAEETEVGNAEENNEGTDE